MYVTNTFNFYKLGSQFEWVPKLKKKYSYQFSGLLTILFFGDMPRSFKGQCTFFRLYNNFNNAQLTSII